MHQKLQGICPSFSDRSGFFGSVEYFYNINSHDQFLKLENCICKNRPLKMFFNFFDNNLS